MASGVEREARVVAAVVARVRDVDEASVDGDADGLDAARGHRAASDRAQSAVGVDAQHRDLIAAGVDGQQVLAAARDLQGALRTDAGSRSRATRHERRSVQRRQRTVGVPVEGGDRVRSRGVVVDV